MNIDRIKNANFFVKGDISGIQDFIFNVKSERAAKTLKARSLFISVVAKAALKLIASQKHLLVDTFYEGGGNFYAFVKADNESQLQILQSNIARALQRQDLYLTLSFVDFNYERDALDFGQLWEALNQESQKDKLEQFKMVSSAFEPFQVEVMYEISTKKETSEAEAWRNLTDTLAQSKGFKWGTTSTQMPFLYPRAMSVFGQRLELSRDGSEFSKSILNKLPQWNQIVRDAYEEAITKVHTDYVDQPPDTRPEDIMLDGRLIPFEYLSAFSAQRNGSSKLGILKLDVDNLGREFEKPGDMTGKETLSAKLDEFFNMQLFQLMQKETFAFHDGSDHYSHNLYTIFAGGDDCFFIGGWDAVFELARAIRSAFRDFLQKNNLPELTLSAALLVVDDKFPVVRFAELAEEALSAAKNHRVGSEEPSKNKVSVFGEVLTWDDFEKARDYALRLEMLIRVYKRPKSILNRLKNVGAGYDRIYRQVEENQRINAMQVSRLAFYLGKLHDSRNPRQDPSRQLTEEILQECQKALLLTLTGRDKQPHVLNPMVFPVAARWAELLCRNAKSD